MKTNFRNVMMAAAALIIGFSSCSSDDENGVPEPTNNEAATTMSLVISQPTTYAVDNNATTAEVAINTVDVFIYTVDGGVDVFEKHEHLLITDFQQTGANSNTWQLIAGKKIGTTTGAKKIYVGVNLPAGMANKVINDGPATGVHSIANIAELNAPANGFAMFSRNVTAATFVADDTDPANTVNTQVARLLSKVVVNRGPALSMNVNGGVISNLEFAVSNNNKKFFALPDNVDFKDPNWATPMPLPSLADFFPAAAVDYKDVNANGTALNVANGVYTTENTSDGIIREENTYASIRGVFVPTNIVKLTVPGDGTSGIEAGAAITAGTTFYKVIANGMIYYFSIQADAVAYALSSGGVRFEYTGGLAYYNVWLNPVPARGETQFDVLRNQIYVVNIIRINGLGAGEDGSGTGTIEAPTNITVTVDIEAWSVSAQDAEI